MTDTDVAAAQAFIDKWKGVAASELSTSQSFLIDLCELLGVDRPHPTPEQDYMFERPLTFQHADGSTSPGRVDLYRRGAFVLESKKIKAGAHTRGFDETMLRAHSQAQAYARALPAVEGRPPFLLVVDVGHRIEVFSEFSRSGGNYVPFPDPRSHRIALDDLRDPAVRQRLRSIWLDPLALDPSRESARVTRQIAARLAELAKSLEQAGHAPEAVAQFLMRCLFTMFAEDVRLLPADSFRTLLATHRERPDVAMRMLAQLWQDMDGGGFSAVLAEDVLRFNGKLFKQPDTLPLDIAQVDLLIEAARADWKHVEPAIFGTLLERALSPQDRHKLGAHYTPRAYVERLVLPTVIEPLRAEWSDAQAAAFTLVAEAKQDEAVAELLRFHHRLCTVRVLDPACGSGNFLYVTLEHLKRLEGEVLGALDDLGHRQTGLALGGERADAAAGETVDPHNLLGIELNPRAAAIAEVVLWIGYLQWHFRTRGDVNPPVPVIRDFRNIENRDAVLAYDRVEYVTDAAGVPVTRWDGETMKLSPVTGEKIPDETARKPLERYVNPRKAAWPQADFVVGNPPFIGNKRMRTALGDGYVEALRAAWEDISGNVDFVMLWWHRAASFVLSGQLGSFGLITTNSITQVQNRAVVEQQMQRGISISFAIPDHPWVEATDGAAVRIAMTVGRMGDDQGRLGVIAEEGDAATDGSAEVTIKWMRNRIHSNLSVGTDITKVEPLKANRGISAMGVILGGHGFFLPEDDADATTVAAINANVASRYVSGTDLAKAQRGRYVVDFTGRTEEEASLACPAAYQWVLDRVRPGRLQNRMGKRAQKWWIFASDAPEMRRAIDGLPRFIATHRTGKHRCFSFIGAGSLAESNVVTIATEDSTLLGVLSSSVHIRWAARAGGTLEDRPHYTNSTIFEPFPFPKEPVNARIAPVAEHLDAHRKRQQAAHPDLTLTGMYNVLDKLRSGEPLTAKERTLHEQGLVSVLRQLHDDLDAAVLDAYGWSDLLPLLRMAHGNDAPADGQTRDDAKRAFDEAILERLVALNAERAAEEARGHIRWLRPEFQNPQHARPEAPADAVPEQGDAFAHADADTDDDNPSPLAGESGAQRRERGTPDRPIPWPKDTVAQVRAVADVLAASPAPLSLDDIAARFTARGPWKKRLPQLLDMLVALGRAEPREGGVYGVGR
ncbi:class I SAM-dependent DNA methyltransferase [Thermomonas mangrovi]|uniref:class I SAM-dependent DNA methyltransferase n=1 Tax=Thermomonas mangrovi TaxID=2993316 RepID=UPI0023073E6C|nr:DNA methyltransferase [Thermomonas mangrovi]